MSEPEWKPGDVAIVECSDGEWRRATCIQGPVGHGSLAWQFHDRGLRSIFTSSARPLLVIDPEDEEQVGWLTTKFLKHVGTDLSARGQDNAMQAALRELIGPPRPAEPMGLGAVIDDRGGHLHVRAPRDDGRPWVGSDGKWRSFDQIDALSLVSEGVQP